MSTGPCITIFLPPFRPGGQSPRGQATLLRNFAQDAARELEAFHLDQAEAEQLLQPLRDLAVKPAAESGSSWSRVILRSPSVFEEAILRQPVQAKSTVRDRFDLLPLLSEMELPEHFYILKISQKNVALFRAGLAVEAVKIPGNVPDTAAGFLDLDIPDHDRENRSPVAPGTRRVRFGTGTERETQPNYLADYYRALDHALYELPDARTTPLILAGVDEDTAIYRVVSSYPNLVAQTIRDEAPDIMREKSYAALRAAIDERIAKALEESRERLAPSRLVTDLDTAIDLAADGRVGRVFIRGGALDHREEKLNAAAVETIRHGGEALTIPAEKMPGSEITAVLRF